MNPAGTDPDSLNPYATPASEAQSANNDVVSQDVMQALAGTKPWVRFIAVMMWIGCSMLVLFMALGIYIIAAATKTDAQLVELPARTIALTLGYGFVTILLIYPALKLSKYASNIARLAESRSSAALAEALTEQRRFWKFCGILTIIHTILTLLLFIASFFVTRVR